MEPIDFVVTWVDGSDPVWIEKKNKAVAESGSDFAYEHRYRDWGIFKYWFRGVQEYAPWVNKVYLVTDGQLPDWINLECEKLVHVRHDQIIDSQFLPTFNTNAIELAVSRIPGLSEHFVLFNDDTFINQPIDPEYFFVDGLPVEMFKETYINPRGAHLAAMQMMNMYQINRFFCKDPETGEIVERDSCPQGTPVYGFWDHHAPAPYKRSVFHLVTQEKCTFEVRQTQKTPFRSAANITSWLVRYWQLASGEFSNTRTYSSRTVNIESGMSLALEFLQDPEVKMLCINDQGGISDYEKLQKIYRDAFEAKLPQRSMFER